MPPGVPVQIVDGAAPADGKGAPGGKPADKSGSKAPAKPAAPAEKKV
jgi:hypothetical protein